MQAHLGRVGAPHGYRNAQYDVATTTAIPTAVQRYVRGKNDTIHQGDDPNRIVNTTDIARPDGTTTTMGEVG